MHKEGRDIKQPCVAAIRKELRDGVVYIVGKGPSLDTLTADDFAQYPAAPILCLNESIHTITRLPLPDNRLFCVQHDQLNGVCNKPQRGTWLLAEYAWEIQKGQEHGAVYWDLKQLSDRPNLTATSAISMAALAGATTAHMMAFDAAITGNCDYAPSIGHSPELPNRQVTRFKGFAKHAIPQRAHEEGVHLIWHSPKDFWYIAYVMRSGPKYSLAQVASVHDEVTNHIKTPYKELLFTDAPGAAHAVIPLKEKWPGWFSKLELFRPDLAFYGGVLYLDLASILGRDISLPPWDTVLTPGRLCMWKDPWSKVTPYASGTMAWIMGTVTEPFTAFKKSPVLHNPTIYPWGDQNIINPSMQGRIDDIEPMLKVRSYKAHYIRDRKQADVVAFHGRPKPWDIGWSTINPPGAFMEQSHYDYAGFYDKYWKVPKQIGLPSPDLSLFAETVVSLFHDKKVLDIGCGEGWLVDMLVRGRVNAFGVDVSKVALERALVKYANRFMLGSATKLPYENASFDAVVSTDVLEHLTPEDVDIALQEIRRVIKDRALIRVANTEAKHKGAHLTVEPKEWWEQQIKAAGFTLLPCPFDTPRTWQSTFLLAK